MSDKEPLFSRTGRTCVIGSPSEEIKTKLAIETFEGMLRKVRLSGMSRAEYLRTLVEVDVHGLDMVKSLHEARLNFVSGIGTERGHDEN